MPRFQAARQAQAIDPCYAKSFVSRHAIIPLKPGNGLKCLV
ncbi:hypothetical protein [Pantoea ananatis]|nr:hypothetical protein [Pantoea ananatis]